MSAVPKDTVVIAIDGSNQAEEAFQWYMKHIHQEGNELVLAHGMELPSVPTRDAYEKQHAEGTAKSKALQEKYTQKFQELKITGKYMCDFEKPGEYIVETAKKENASYIIMGTRGLGKIRRTIMGSVSDFVVHHATCPVVVCRLK